MNKIRKLLCRIGIHQWVTEYFRDAEDEAEWEEDRCVVCGRWRY